MEVRLIYEQWVSIPLGLMLILVLTALMRYKKLGYLQKALSLLVLIALISDLSSYYFWKQRINTYPIMHIYALLDFSIMVLIYNRALGLKLRRLQLVMIIVALWGYGVVNALFFQDLSQPNSNVILPFFVIWVVASMLSLAKMIGNKTPTQLSQHAMFWINIGVLVYCTSSFLLFTFSERLLPIPLRATLPIWLLHIFFNVIRYASFNVSLWMRTD